MSRSRSNIFATIRTEGAILPADLIQRIAEGDKNLQGLKPVDYYLTPTEKLGEAVSRSWNRLVGLWRSFRAAEAQLPEADLGTALTRERWLIPLFQELGYEKLPLNKTQEIGGRTYPISHLKGHTPIHLVGFRIEMDRRTAGVAGAARTSPHSLVQEFLNRSHDNLWGFVSNGHTLRILRDNSSLTRQTYVEFDLETMFEGESFSDFSLLWLLCHASRVDSEKPEECWLENWSKMAQKEGARALDELRDGVEKAITALGQGFLAHPDNGILRESLRSGKLDKQEYYRQLLRLVYRLIFLFVAEDRDLLLDPKCDAEARERYFLFYSTRRLRNLAGSQRGTRHADLYEGFKVTADALGNNEGCSLLGLMALGSFLWSDSTLPDLSGLISNGYFLKAVRSLAYRVADGALRPVDYKNLRSEELGSVYEALLELHPEINLEAATFNLKTLAGHERKTSGSYYTPDSLVQCLLDSALDPVVQQSLDEVVKKTKQKGSDISFEQEAERAILSLKVCDPATGSGHFLVAAAHRLGKRLAAVRTGDDEPSPEAYRTALRDVIGRCVYGVDINPMSVELCKVSLWLEAMDPGKPLTFLDHHIRVGNSLLGTTPELIAKGIPDEAFKPIEGDDKAVCSTLKKRNKQERESGQQDMMHMMVAEQSAEYGSIEAQTRGLNEAPDETLDEIQRKANQFHRLVVSPEYQHAQLVADAWCTAFVWKKQADAPFEPITTDTVRRIEANPKTVELNQRAEVERLARQYQFFHWHLAFPEVFAKGGFDCVLGNPPWDMVELSEKEFFASRNPEIAQATSARRRQEMIRKLETEHPASFHEFTAAKRMVYSTRHLLQDTDRFPYSSRGRINLYPLFVENAAALSAGRGRVGIIVPSAISMDAYNAPLFSWLVREKRLVSLFDFDNNERLFPDVDSRYRFCLLTLAGYEALSSKFGFCFSSHSTDELKNIERQIVLSLEEIETFSPNTLAPPMFLNAQDAILAKVTYKKYGVLENHNLDQNPWGMSIQRMHSLSDPGDMFRKMSDLASGDVDVIDHAWTRLYSGKAIHQFAHRFATYNQNEWRPVSESEAKDPNFSIKTEYYVRPGETAKRIPKTQSDGWLLVYRDVTNATNERTVIAAIIPYAGCDTTCRNIYSPQSPTSLACFLASVNSMVFDYFARQKVIGMHLGAGVFEQLPVLLPESYEQTSVFVTDAQKIKIWLLPRVLELTYTAWDLKPFARDCGWSGLPFRWEEERRFLLRCELDAAFFHLYFPADVNGDWRQAEGETAEDLARLKTSFPTPRHAVDYIMDTFPIVKRKDEEKYNSDYRTKRVILEIYDAMAEAIRTGKPYVTHLNPPPADPRCCHPPR